MAKSKEYDLDQYVRELTTLCSRPSDIEVILAEAVSSEVDSE